MATEHPNANARDELLKRLAQAGARIQRELSREAILRRACDALCELGLRCTTLEREGGGWRVLRLHPEAERVLEEAGGSSIVGTVRPTTPILERVWGDGLAYTQDWPSEAARFTGVPVDALVATLGREAFARGVGVRVPESCPTTEPDAGTGSGTAPGLVFLATGGWLLEEDAGAFRLFAEQVGAALDAARTVQALRERNADLTLLNDLAAATVTLDTASLLEQVLARATSRLRGDASVVYLQRDGGREVVARCGVRSALSAPPPPSPTDLSEIAMSRKAAARWPGDVADTPRNRWFREHQGVLSAVAVPLLAKDRTIGCCVMGRRSGVPFNDEEVRLLSAVGLQLGIAVDNARLYEDLRRSYAALARAQEQLIQQERFAALGQLSAVIAHEVRNPLGVIFNSLGTLRRLVPDAGDARMLLAIIGEEADRLNRIVADLLEFARPAPPAPRRESLSRILDEAVTAAGLPSSIRFERDVPDDLPPVPMDPHLFRQALVNLFSNAVQAMPAGGALSVRARRDGDAVRLEVTDTGDGVPEELRQRIFEPFFTTRPTGTGLGLAIVKRIVDEHRASISVEPGEPVGTRFVVLLPLSPPDAAPPLSPAPAGE